MLLFQSFFNRFIYSFRESEERGRDTGGGRSRLRVGSPMWDSILGLQDLTPVCRQRQTAVPPGLHCFSPFKTQDLMLVTLLSCTLVFISFDMLIIIWGMESCTGQSCIFFIKSPKSIFRKEAIAFFFCQY